MCVCVRVCVQINVITKPCLNIRNSSAQKYFSPKKKELRKFNDCTTHDVNNFNDTFKYCLSGNVFLVLLTTTIGQHVSVVTLEVIQNVQ